MMHKFNKPHNPNYLSLVSTLRRFVDEADDVLKKKRKAIEATEEG